jgi:hypothetical protein
MRRITVALTTLFITARAMSGQDVGIAKGTVEIGAFGQLNRPSTALPLTDASGRWGGGGRFGLFVARNLAIELDASSNPFELALPGACGAFTVSCSVTYTPVHAQLVFNAPVSNRFFFLFGGGVSDQRLSAPIQNNKFGIGATAGFRYRASSTLSLRFAGVLDVLPKGTYDVVNTYVAGQFGLDFLLGGGHGCDHAADAITIQPTSAVLQPSQSRTFSAAAEYCGRPDEVVFRLTGSGSLDSVTGSYVAATPGTARIAAYGRKGKLTSAADVTVTAPIPVAPPPPPPPSVVSVAIVGPSRAKMGVRIGYTAQAQLSDGSRLSRRAAWSVISGTATMDDAGGLTTTAPGTVVIQAQTENVTAIDSVTSYDWVPFGGGTTFGATLDAATLDNNQGASTEYPRLLIGCVTGTFVLGVVTPGIVPASGDVSYSFGGGPATFATWLEVPPDSHSLTYFGGTNAARKSLAVHIDANEEFGFEFHDNSGAARAATFAVTGMTGAMASSIAACPGDGPRRPLVTASDSATAIKSLLAAWRLVSHH